MCGSFILPELGNPIVIGHPLIWSPRSFDLLDEEQVALRALKNLADGRFYNHLGLNFVPKLFLLYIIVKVRF